MEDVGYGNVENNINNDCVIINDDNFQKYGLNFQDLGNQVDEMEICACSDDLCNSARLARIEYLTILIIILMRLLLHKI